MKRTILLALICCSGLVRANDTITMHVTLAEITATEKVYDVVFDDFDYMLAYQWALAYDTSGMSFKEIRNSNIPYLDAANFNVAIPGEVRTVWFHPTLEALDYPNPMTGFQLVFDLHDPAGSALCLSDAFLDYQFAREIGGQQIELSTLIMYDDCHQPFILPLQTTSVGDISHAPNPIIHHVFGQQDGTISLISDAEMTVYLSLVDMSGREILPPGQHSLVIGRNTFHTGKELMGGMYTLTEWSAKTTPNSVRFFVR